MNDILCHAFQPDCHRWCCVRESEEKALTQDAIEAHKSTLRQAALDGVPLPPKKTRKARARNPLKPKPKNSGTGNETPGEKRRKIANRVSAKKSRNKRSAEDEHSEEEH